MTGSELELSGKVAIVTGAGRLRGIGRATANVLARMGADVVVTGTGRDRATFPPDEKEAGWRDIESTAEEVRSFGVKAKAVVMDVTKGGPGPDPDRRYSGGVGQRRCRHQQRGRSLR